MTRLPFLYLAHSEARGRGIYTAQEIPAGSIIELCPVIVIPSRDLLAIHKTVLHDYYFLWGTTGEAALALGYGSIYNHAATPNADYEMEFAEQQIRIFAKRDIAAGEEIMISYTE
ncbi:MAG: SET domain-containing protein-lysine N-methyltransferase, partial [Bacteroidetes bacterium]